MMDLLNLRDMVPTPLFNQSRNKTRGKPGTKTEAKVVGQSRGNGDRVILKNPISNNEKMNDTKIPSIISSSTLPSSLLLPSKELDSKNKDVTISNPKLMDPNHKSEIDQSDIKDVTTVIEGESLEVNQDFKDDEESDHELYDEDDT